MRICLTKEQAISVLPDGDSIHTFYNCCFGLLRADWDRQDLVDKITKSDIIELAGETARSMKHGITVYNKTATRQDEVLFVETDEEKLTRLEQEVAPKVHEVKTLPKYFQPQAEGLKSFEVRRNDRDYQVGDILRQKEWTQEGGYTGRALDREIVYVLDDPTYCKEGFVVLGLREVEK